jgi:hypothetical protein
MQGIVRMEQFSSLNQRDILKFTFVSCHSFLQSYCFISSSFGVSDELACLNCTNHLLGVSFMSLAKTIIHVPLKNHILAISLSISFNIFHSISDYISVVLAHAK